ncbi:MAG: EamA family transporter [Anaerolineae bacterium]
MTGFAILLVLVSSAMHAFWNYVTKRVSTNNVIFVWLASAMEIVLLAVPAVWTLLQQESGPGWAGALFVTVSAILHIAYFLLLTHGYRVGDLSIVYPLARGVGPLLVTAGAILLLGETPSVLALIGTLLITLGVLTLTGDPRVVRQSAALPGIIYGLLTALSVAAYSLWDSVAVTRMAIPPIVYLWGVAWMRTLLLMPLAFRNREELPAAWARDRWRALLVALFSPGGYVLILIALTFSPVSYVAPMRSISILIGVVMGAQVLKEDEPRRRLAGALAMVLGVGLLGIG